MLNTVLLNSADWQTAVDNSSNSLNKRIRKQDLRSLDSLCSFVIRYRNDRDIDTDSSSHRIPHFGEGVEVKEVI